MSKKARTTGGNAKRSKLIELINESYIGEVVDIDDPQFIGRCKIRIFGVFGDKKDSIGFIPIKDLPYSYPINDLWFGSASGSGKFSTPKLNTLVRVIFEDDIYHPRYIGIEELDDEMKNVLKDNYENFHSLIWDSDEQLRIYYSVKSGFIIELKGSFINILPDGDINTLGGKDYNMMISGDINAVVEGDVNIICQNANILGTDVSIVDAKEVKLGTKAVEAIVKGDTFKKIYDLHTHIGNLGAETAPPSTPLAKSALSTKSKTE